MFLESFSVALLLLLLLFGHHDSAWYIHGGDYCPPCCSWAVVCVCVVCEVNANDDDAHSEFIDTRKQSLLVED